MNNYYDPSKQKRLLCCEHCKVISEHWFNQLEKVDGDIHRKGICPHCGAEFYSA